MKNKVVCRMNGGQSSTKKLMESRNPAVCAMKTEQKYDDVPLELQRELESKRAPLSKQEFDALKTLIGTCRAFKIQAEFLKERLHTQVPHGWRDARMLVRVSDKLFHQVVLTIPSDKLATLAAEMGRYESYVRLRTVTPYDEEETDNKIVGVKDLKTLAAFACQMNCPLCDKEGKAVKKCPLRETLQHTLEYNLPSVMPNGGCVFQEFDLNDLGTAGEDAMRWAKDMRGYEYDGMPDI